jgi:hypothetical protein
MESLTKENFWDEMEQKYPKAMKHFKEWVDRYKIENNWDYLFNANYNKEPWSNYIGGPETTEAPKYHELPIAMQFGIFLEWYFTCSKRYSRISKTLSGLDNPKSVIEDLLIFMQYLIERGKP